MRVIFSYLMPGSGWLGLVLLALVLPLSARDIPPDSSEQAEISLSCTVLAETGQRFCVEQNVLVPGSEARWWLLSGEEEKKPLPGPGPAMLLIDRLLASPSGRFLAVVSVGEGHPILEVFELRPILAGESAEALVEINPYPGVLSLEGWRKNSLLFYSDRRLPACFGPENENEACPELPGNKTEQLFELKLLNRTLEAVETAPSRDE